MTISVIKEELEEFPEVELPDVEFDAPKVLELLEVAGETKDSYPSFAQAAQLELKKLHDELKKTLDQAMEDYKKACDEREGKILQARAEKAKAEQEEEDDAA